jgi:16S rRNA (uracil1498-N3)-methyltransferase
MKHTELFYIPPEEIQEDRVEFKGTELKHLTVVLRKKVHEVVTVVDGVGNLYSVVLREIGKKSAIGIIQKKSRFVGEPNFQLTLAQAIPKGTRFDLVVEKGTEIGISKFIPLFSERSQLEGNPNKVSRWKKIAIAAMKQSCRSVLPEITAPLSFEQLLSSKEIYDFQFLAHPEDSGKGLATLLLGQQPKATHISRLKKGIIVIGPEGGFSQTEINKAKAQHYEVFSLGKRRLRSETAGIVSAAIIMELVDNLI